MTCLCTPYLPPLLLLPSNSHRLNWSSRYFEIYPPVKLRGIHHHFVLYGPMGYLGRSFDRQFPADEVMQLLDRFYNIEMLKSDDEDIDILNHGECFTLPQGFFDKEEQ